MNQVASRPIDMMRYNFGTPSFPYAENSRLRVVKLPYDSKDFEMAVFLPKQRFGLQAIRNTITGREFQGLLSQAQVREVLMFLPKFHLETSLNLVQNLQQLGMSSAFGGFADFSGMVTRPLRISDILHKALITVAENGTEAAAATAVLLVGGAPPGLITPVLFRADEPFLYTVLYQNRPLFFGQYF